MKRGRDGKMAKGISRRGLLEIAGGTALAAAAGFTSLRGLFGRKKPENIVLIVSDAFRADRLGAVRNGKSVTPNLDALACESLVYEECYATSSWTKTSMASILTGTYPPYHGVLRVEDTIPRHCDTVSDMLKRHGYSTYAVQTNPWVAPEAPTLDTHGTPVKTYGFHKGFDRCTFLQPDKRADGGQPAYADAAKVNHGIDVLIRRPFRPFFLYAHYMETHQPWMGEAPRKFTGLYCSEKKGRSPEEIFADDCTLIKKVFSVDRKDVTPQDERRLNEIYDEAVHYVDVMIAKLIDNIAHTVGLEDTLIIFTADHGDELFEHSHVGHARSLYEEVTRVPLIIRGPGLGPARVAGRVSNANIYETIRDLVCPQDNAREAMGRPLAGIAAGSSRIGDEIIFAELHSLLPSQHWLLSKVVRKDSQEAIVRGNLKGEVLAVERYDLGKDPGELAAFDADGETFVAEVARLKRDCSAFARKHGVQHTQTATKWQRRFGRKEESETAEVELTDEEKRLTEQLKALGYLN
ncbi:MAG: sulfatase [Planctomycetes bacterium]|nr:sulfatase [Planctomycetota bacterium]